MRTTTNTDNAVNTDNTRIVRVHSTIRAAVERRASMQALMEQQAVDAILAAEAVTDKRSAARIQALITQEVTAQDTAARCARERFDRHVANMLFCLALDRAVLCIPARMW